MEFMFEPIEFINNLKYMGLGLLGTFVIIGIIIGATMAFNNISNKLAEKKKAEQESNEQ